MTIKVGQRKFVLQVLTLFALFIMFLAVIYYAITAVDVNASDAIMLLGLIALMVGFTTGGMQFANLMEHYFADKFKNILPDTKESKE